MKFDTKTIIIAILGFIILGFVMFGGGRGQKNKFKSERVKLQNKLDSIQIKKQAVDYRIDSLENNYKKLLYNNTYLKKKNDSLSININNQTIIYIKSTVKIKDLKEQMNLLKNNPPNRKGDTLINSLRNKFN